MFYITLLIQWIKLFVSFFSIYVVLFILNNLYLTLKILQFLVKFNKNNLMMIVLMMCNLNLNNLDILVKFFMLI